MSLCNIIEIDAIHQHANWLIAHTYEVFRVMEESKMARTLIMWKKMILPKGRLHAVCSVKLHETWRLE